MSNPTRSSNATAGNDWFSDMMSTTPTSASRQTRPASTSTGGGSVRPAPRQLQTLGTGPRINMGLGETYPDFPVLSHDEVQAEEKKLLICICEKSPWWQLDRDLWVAKGLALCGEGYKILPSLLGDILVGSKAAGDVPFYGTGEGRRAKMAEITAYRVSMEETAKAAKKQKQQEIAEGN